MTPQPKFASGGERDFRLLVESASDGIVVLSHDDAILFANKSARLLSGLSGDEQADLHLSRVLPPEEANRVLAIRAARRAGRPAPGRYDSTLLRPDGERIPVEVAVDSITWLGRPAEAVVIRDISEQRRAETELRQRESVLQGVASAAESLVRSLHWRISLDQALGCLGQAVGVQRVYLWEARFEPDGEVRTINRHLWVDAAYPGGPDPASLEGYPLRASGYGSWIDVLMRGEPLVSQRRDFPASIQSTYGALGVSSVLSVPIMVDDRLWGVLGLSDCERERNWPPFEIDALGIMSNILGALIRRERSREALRLSEEQLRTTVEQAPTGIFIADEEGRFSAVNTSGCQMLGYSRDDLLGLSIYDVVPPEVASRAKAHFEHAKTGGVIRLEGLMRTRQGKSINVDIIPKRLSDGRLQAIVTDITARREMESALRRHDAILEAVTFAAEQFLTSPPWEDRIRELLERLGRATDASRVHVYETQPEPGGEIRLVRRHSWGASDAPPYPALHSGNVFRLRSLGFGPWLDQAPGAPLTFQRSKAPPDARALFDSLGIFSLLIVPIRVRESWWGVLGLSDCRREHDWSSREVDALRAAGNIIGAMIHSRQTEAALVESEAKYRSLVEGAQLSIVQIDSQGVFRFANSAAASRLGFEQAEIPGKSMWDLFPETIADRQVSILRATIEKREPTTVVMPTVVQGVERWHETRIHPLTDPEGHCDSALVLVADVTERKTAEERILSYQDRLRSLSSELGLVELRERRRIAGELHDRIGQTLAIAKMRLGALRASAGTHLIAGLDEVRTLIDQTIQDTRSLTFDLSPPILHELGLEPALEWLVERFQGQHGIPVTFQDDRKPKPLAGNVRVILFQCVQELLMNVVKHARAHRVEVRVARGEGKILLTVVDDGIGFDTARAATADPRTAGFGLFSIRERLSSLGGQIELESGEKGGTSIRLSAPLDSETADTIPR